MSSGENIILTGFMGTGKTSVGRVLASRLDMEFVDTDEIIESRHGPIARIFAEQGEKTFRELERQLARELGQRRGTVIATGGGMMLDPTNVDVLTRHGRVFCLMASPEEIYRRVMKDEIPRERPLLAAENPLERITELIDERSDGYASFRQIATDERDVDDIADEIGEFWSETASEPVVNDLP